MTFKLYNAPQSTCSQRVRFVFNGKKIPFDEVKLNLLEGDQLKPDYLEHAQGFANKLADGLGGSAQGASPVSPQALDQQPTDPTKVSAHE